MFKKVFIDYNEVEKLVDTLSQNIKSNFEPEVIIAISGGGLIPARLLRNYLNVPILSINLKLYKDVGVAADNVTLMQGLDELSSDFIKDKNVLIVDEIHDSGKTMNEAYNMILKYVRDSKSLSASVLHYKDIDNKDYDIFDLPADAQFFYAELAHPDEWIIYPWSKN